jgi:hypothetical protein
VKAPRTLKALGKPSLPRRERFPDHYPILAGNRGAGVQPAG